MITGRRFAALAFLTSAPFFLPSGSDPLHVLRALPTGDAPPNAQLRVTFDRPVAGSLDYTVDPKTVLHLSPDAAGTLEWRDPVTVVFTPSQPFRAATEYTVTVDTTFHAMDGARLERPYSFSFSVGGPRIIGGTPVSAATAPTDLRPNAKFDLVWSSAVDAGRVAAVSYVELSRSCAAAPGATVRMRALGRSRPITADDDWTMHEAGGSSRDRTTDSLRRIVSLAPVTPLPLDCSAELVSRFEIDSSGTAPLTRWPFSTYGPLLFTRAECSSSKECPTGPVILYFTTPVRGSELRKKVTMIPATPFTMADTSRESTTWQLDARLRPRARYAVVVDTSLRDVFGQKVTGNPAQGLETSGYAPSVSYPYGRMLVERDAFGTLAVQHVNVDTLVVTAAAVPDSLESRFLRSAVWNWETLWKQVEPGAKIIRVPVRRAVDQPMITGVKIPVVNGAGHRGLVVVRIGGPAGVRVGNGQAIALVQVSDLAVHAKIGAASAVVWVTRVSTGAALPDVQVTLHDSRGKALATARTDARGLASFPQIVRVRAVSGGGDADGGDDSDVPDCYVEATLGDDRALVGITEYDPDLSPWRFGVSSAWGNQRLPLAAAIFTERGIYRPGEPLYAKAILRRGTLGSLAVPAGRDSVRIVFHDREGAIVQQRVRALTPFGTASDEFRVPATAKLGYYTVGVQYFWQGRWEEVDQAGYRVAEYRPPEFLVDVTGPQRPFFGGDSVTAKVEARYLFGAPMAHAAVQWQATRRLLSWWDLEVPGLADGEWYVGESSWWWDEDDSDETSVVASGTDTLDAAGRLTLRAATPPAEKGRAARMTMTASVIDVNRQVVSAATAVTVHPAAFYIAAKPMGTSYFWRAGTAQSIGLIAVSPGGARVPGIEVRGSVVRREWHQVHRERDGAAEVVGEWVSDTVARCTVTTRGEPVPCNFTPAEGGMYVVGFTATDAQKREARTSLTRWAGGSDWVPWEDESRFKMDVIADKPRYAVGDTATVMLASPFTGAEAWVTVEREGIIEQRRLTLTSGSTVLKFPITEAFVPNAYVSVLVARGRSAPPGTLDDPGRPTMRVGYAQLRVTPEIKRLTVTVQPLATEYRPADSAHVSLHVADSRGAGKRAEVTLWAVDEGVLALTGYKTPDPIDLLYRERGLGMRLASNLVSVAPQIPEGEKGRRAPGGGGGNAAADVLRSRFKTTAFFLGSVVTDAAGNAVAIARLPDNLTTFRVMAVAVTAGDRYGSGDSKMLVTRPLVARPALPRFVRPGDEFTAGAVINRRSGAPGAATVTATVVGIETRGDSTQRAQLAPGRGVEVRFPFRAPTKNAGDQGDSAAFRFSAASGSDADAVQSKLPFRPDYHPRAYTASGVLHDTASVEIIVPQGIDPSRSRVDFSLGGSVLSLVRGAYDHLHVYPWYCTEQVTSSGRPLLALYRARAAAPTIAPPNAKHELELAVTTLSERQRDDGGIGYWGNEDWTTPWLTAYAGEFLVDARSVGIAVDDSVLARMAAYLKRELKADTVSDPIMRRWYGWRWNVLGDRVAIVDLLSRLRQPDVAAENRLVAQAAQLRAEDRSRLAEVLARRGELRTAAGLLASQWAAIHIEGRRAVLPDSVLRDTTFYFTSSVRPAARLLIATLAVAPDHPLIGPLVENVVQQGRAAPDRWWNTQDWSMAVTALAAFDRATHRTSTGARGTVRIRAGSRILYQAALDSAAPADSSTSLTGLLADAADGAQALRVRLEREGSTAPAYYYVTVHEVPQHRPVRPDDHGIQVERWYERYDGGAPITSVVEGELVRVRLRVTIPADREFLVLDDALPAGLEAVDLSLRTSALMAGPGTTRNDSQRDDDAGELGSDDERAWGYGMWESGWWSPFDHREIRDDRVVYFATQLWKGSYSASYVARATTPGVFVRPPAHAEEMYNPAIFGRSDGGVFTVTKKQ